jgi:adenosylcobinamide-phosphate synthase
MVGAVEAALYPSLFALACAASLDALVQLPSAVHPVAWFGKFAQLWIAHAPSARPSLAFGAGVLLALGLPACAGALAWFALSLVSQVHRGLALALQVFLVYACVCLYGLLEAASQLERALRERGLPAARERLRWLCSRDPSQLDETALVNGTIESLAENLSDSVIAPLFFLCWGGLPAAVAYRAINTLDAMIGYRGRYEWLGKATAKIDDAVNYVPARLTAALLWLAATSCSRSQRLSPRGGWTTWRADHTKTPSPNGGHPMAMAAGLLGVRLDKPETYVLGSALPAPTRPDLQRALILCRRTGLLALVLGAAVLWILGGPLV